MAYKIVLLDGYTANQGDLSWDKLKTLGDVIIYDRTSLSDLYERTKDADIVLSNKTLLNKEILSKLPKLKYVSLLSTGLNIIDLDYAREINLPVSNIPGYSTDSVAQLTFAFILAFANTVKEHSDSVKNGDWVKCRDFSYSLCSLTELANKTLGIVGYGQIGRKVHEIASAFSMKVIINSRTKPSDIDDKMWRSFDQVLAESDFLTLHTPLTDQNIGMINYDSLSKMKNTAYLINTARGGLINEEEVAKALNEGLIRGFAADVMVKEPPYANNPLLISKNTILTPHIAWATKEARQRLINILYDNVKAFIDGNPINLV